jgi:hypothetical protein
LPQFLFPLTLVLAVVLGVTVGVVPDAVIFLIFLVLLLLGRVRYVRTHPPDPELVSKRFWEA